MITPTESDIGRPVVYTGNTHPGGNPEYGVITSFGESAVFVQYTGEHASKATSREDLEWAHEPRHLRTGMFVLHDCWKCRDGKFRCVIGNPRQCEYPHARND